MVLYICTSRSLPIHRLLYHADSLHSLDCTCCNEVQSREHHRDGTGNLIGKFHHHACIPRAAINIVRSTHHQKDFHILCICMCWYPKYHHSNMIPPAVVCIFHTTFLPKICHNHRTGNIPYLIDHHVGNRKLGTDTLLWYFLLTLK